MASNLPSHLHSLLRALHTSPYPHVPTPANCHKRASIALIIRIHPSHAAWPPSSPSSPTTLPSGTTSNPTLDALSRFFARAWVQQGEPEVLFIKRAARPGDRWDGHVALPGGKRDPDDADDCAVAVRETLEEVGIDLTRDGAVHVGNLPESVVTTSWGRTPLMVLCPFVFLLTSHALPPLRLQPEEVGSAHWVPLRALLLPGLRTFEHADVTERLARRWGRVAKYVLRLALGKMLFAAVRLVPTESLWSRTGGEASSVTFGDGGASERAASVTDGLRAWWQADGRRGRPLLLWGLTLAIVADFLNLLPAHDALRFWTYPTFTPVDLRFVLWLVSYSHRRRKERELQSQKDEVLGPAVVEEGLEAVAAGGSWREEGEDAARRQSVEVGVGRLGVGVGKRAPRSSVVANMLDGYFDQIRRAVLLTLVLRGVVGGSALLWWMRRWRWSRSVR